MKDKKLRVRFCLDCKSFNVRYIHTVGNLLGIIPKMRCMNCGAEATVFPIMEITQKELDKKNKEFKKKVEKVDDKIKSNNKSKGKEIYVCPKCKSKNVKNNMRYRSDTNMDCLDCGYSGKDFVIIETKSGGKK